MKKAIKWKENFPWTVFIAGVILFCSSLIFKAHDMAVVSLFAILGAIALFVYNCLLDRKNAREVAAYKSRLKEEGWQRIERDCHYLDMLDKEG